MLTKKQKRFCEEYLIDWNATRAAIEAGYSEKTAKEQGYQLLHKTSLKEYIEEISQDISKLAGVSALRNMNELVNIAYSETAADRDKLNAIDKLNKMLPNAYAPVRADHTTGGKELPNSITVNIVGSNIKPVKAEDEINEDIG